MRHAQNILRVQLQCAQTQRRRAGWAVSTGGARTGRRTGNISEAEGLVEVAVQLVKGRRGRCGREADDRRGWGYQRRCRRGRCRRGRCRTPWGLALLPAGARAARREPHAERAKLHKARDGAVQVRRGGRKRRRLVLAGVRGRDHKVVVGDVCRQHPLHAAGDGVPRLQTRGGRARGGAGRCAERGGGVRAAHHGRREKVCWSAVEKKNTRTGTHDRKKKERTEKRTTKKSRRRRTGAKDGKRPRLLLEQTRRGKWQTSRWRGRKRTAERFQDCNRRVYGVFSLFLFSLELLHLQISTPPVVSHTPLSPLLVLHELW